VLIQRDKRPWRWVLQQSPQCISVHLTSQYFPSISACQARLLLPPTRWCSCLATFASCTPASASYLPHIKQLCYYLCTSHVLYCCCHAAMLSLQVPWASIHLHTGPCLKSSSCAVVFAHPTSRVAVMLPCCPCRYPGLASSCSYRQLTTVGCCHQFTISG
jgi:hypothetical protein